MKLSTKLYLSFAIVLITPLVFFVIILIYHFKVEIGKEAQKMVENYGVMAKMIYQTAEMEMENLIKIYSSNQLFSLNLERYLIASRQGDMGRTQVQKMKDALESYLDQLKEKHRFETAVLISESGEYIAGDVGEHWSFETDPSLLSEIAFIGGTISGTEIVTGAQNGKKAVSLTAMNVIYDYSRKEVLGILVIKDIMSDSIPMLYTISRTIGVNIGFLIEGRIAFKEIYHEGESFLQIEGNFSETFDFLSRESAKFLLDKGGRAVCTIPIMEILNEEIAGHLLLEIDAHQYVTRFNVGILLIIGIFILGACLSIVFKKMVFYSILNPIQQLKQKTEAIIEGNYDSNDGKEFVADDEFGELTRQFNKMRDNLKKYSTDIRDLSRIKDDLNNAMKATEQANQAKTEFLANMSHEIRTPMNVILGMTDLLEKRGHLTRNQKSFTTTIKSSADHLLHIINDILDISKIESGQVSLERVPFNLETETDKVVRLLTQKAREKGLEFVYQVNPAVNYNVFGDPYRFKQVIINLLSNAVKFTNYGKILLSLNFEEGQFEISIKDTGIGIPSTFREHIFDTFTQADTSMKRKYGGTGLGLAITKKLIDSMEGEINFTSQERQGTEFFVNLELPVRTDEKEGVEPRKDHQVLIIGDSKSAHIPIISNYLFYKGYNVKNLDAQNLKTTGTETFQGSIVIDGTYDLNNVKKIFKGRWEKDPTRPVFLLLYDASKNPDASKYKTILVPVIRETLYAVMENRPEIPEASGDKCGKERLENSVSGIRANILLLEDHRPNALLIKQYLESLDVKLVVVENGLKGVEEFKLNPEYYDLILMDLEMPVMNGTEATKRIRDWEMKSRVPPVPIIALTAHVFEEIRNEVIEAGCTDFMPKPVKEEDLVATIDRYVGTNHEKTYVLRQKNPVKKMQSRALKNIYQLQMGSLYQYGLQGNWEWVMNTLKKMNPPHGTNSDDPLAKELKILIGMMEKEEYQEILRKMSDIIKY